MGSKERKSLCMQITFYCAIPLHCTDWYQWRAARNHEAEISSSLKNCL